MNLLGIDFEYCHSAEPDMGLLSCSLHSAEGGTLNYWLRDPVEKQRLIDLLNSIKSTHILIGYEIQLAEARCLAAMGLDPNQWHWRDLLAEWRWLRNETNEFKYGHIVKNGKAYFTESPARRIQKRMTDEELSEARQMNAAHIEAMQAELDEGELAAHDEAGFSMLDCCYFFEMIGLKEYRAAAEVKARVRDEIILSGSDSVIEAHRVEIQEYNAADVKDLLPLADRLGDLIAEVNDTPHIRCVKGEIERGSILRPDEIQLRLGDWAARLAKYAQRGIPLDPARMDRFLEVVPKLTQEIKEGWNREHSEDPLYRVGLPESILELKKRSLEKSPYVSGEYTKDSLRLRHIIAKHCKANGIETWLKTRSGVFATDKKTLGTHASGENIIKQLERHQGQLSNLKAFTVGKDREIEAFRYIGSDCRQRPDFGVHGTQSDRNAHKSKSLLFANAHWMRVLINPPEGMALVECLAENTNVLTKRRGFVYIEDVLLSDELWDGAQWVKHKGVIKKGVRDVSIKYGLRATGDHEFTSETGAWCLHGTTDTYRRYTVSAKNIPGVLLWKMASQVCVALYRQAMQAIRASWGRREAQMDSGTQPPI